MPGLIGNDVVVGFTLLGNLEVETPGVVVQTERTGSGVVAAEAEQESGALALRFEGAEAVYLVAALPTIGVELHLEGAALLEVVSVFLGKEEVLGDVAVGLQNPALADGINLFFGLTSLLGNHDRLEFLLGAGFVDVNFTGTDLLGGIVLQGEGDGVVVGLHVNNRDPVYLGLDGVLVQGNVGNDVGFHAAIHVVGDVVDTVFSIGLLVGGIGIVLLGFAAEVEFHDGGETYLGVGVGESGAFNSGLRGDHELVALHGGAVVAVGEDVHLGAGDLGLHGVGYIEGIGALNFVVGFGDIQTESAGDGNLHGGVVAQGEDYIGSGYFNVLEDAVLQAGAAAEAAQLGLGAGDDSIQLAVLDIDVGHLAHEEVLAFELEGFSVDGPYKIVAFLDDTQGTCTGTAGDLEGNHGAVTIGNGNTVGGLFNLLDVLAQGDCVGSLHLSFQIAHLGLQGGNTVLEFRVVVLFGAARKYKGYSKSRNNSFHK